MKKIALILIILLTITVIVGYGIITYRTNLQESQKRNQEYEAYKNIDLLGTQIISLINKTIDDNEKLDIEKDENGNYIDDNEKSIRININFIYQDKLKNITMESIASGGSEAFVKQYGSSTFRCTQIEYHEKTKNVKQLTFEEIRE